MNRTAYLSYLIYIYAIFLYFPHKGIYLSQKSRKTTQLVSDFGLLVHRHPTHIFRKLLGSIVKSVKNFPIFQNPIIVADEGADVQVIGSIFWNTNLMVAPKEIKNHFWNWILSHSKHKYPYRNYLNFNRLFFCRFNKALASRPEYPYSATNVM